MAGEFPFLVKDGDRQQVGISTPYYRELLERGYSIEDGPAPAEPSSPDNELTEEVKDSGDDQP